MQHPEETTCRFVREFWAAEFLFGSGSGVGH